MRRIVPVLAALLLAAGCGGDDDEASTGEPTGTGGAAGLVDGGHNDITVAEFIAELQPQKQEILEAFVADSAACKGVEVDPAFVLLVSAQAIDADPEGPLAELVEDQC